MMPPYREHPVPSTQINNIALEKPPIIEDKVFWLFYSRQNAAQKQTQIDKLKMFSAPLILYVFKYGIPKSSLPILYTAFLAMNIFGTCHTEVQINNKRKNNTLIKTVRGPNPETGQYDLGIPHLAIAIKVTPAELQLLEKSIEKEVEGIGCSQKSANYLKESIKEDLIPYPIVISPLISTIYLLAKKAISKESRVGNIDLRIKNQQIFRLLSIGMLYEFLLFFAIIPTVFFKSIPTLQR